MRMACFRLNWRDAQAVAFLEKKLRKKLLFQWGVGAATSPGPKSKSFLLLFFKKEVLPSDLVFTRLP
jgi:hypothetical protein